MVDSGAPSLDRTGAPARATPVPNLPPAVSPELRHRRSVAAGRASIGLATLLVGISAFALASSASTHGAAAVAVQASTLSDEYADATRALAAEESLERKYRLEPGPEVGARFDGAAEDLRAALAAVARDGAPGDQLLATRTIGKHERYVVAADRMFRAVDAGDTATTLAIDAHEVDPAYEAMSVDLLAAAEHQHALAMTALADLRRQEDMWLWLTPAVLATGLALGAALVVMLRSRQVRLEAEQARAIYDSRHDALTGLANRTLLADRFAQVIEADARDDADRRTGLLLLDLDRFKEINDTFGHHYGDELLRQVAARLTAALDPAQTVARLGGDEFAVLLPDAGDVSAVTVVAHRLLTELRETFRVEGIDIDVEASVGVVLSGVHGDDQATLLQRADVAMYAAKADQIGIATYDAAADSHSPERLALLGELRRALDRGELLMHYQPKVRLSDGAVVGAEALVRWQHPERGLVFPDAFIPLTEHTALIGPFTRYVLDHALAQSRAWSDEGRPLTVSVNLSARNLLDEGLPHQVAAQLAAHGVDASALELEVTETALMSDPVRARRILEELAALGLRISLDDFGAGHTSLSQLSDLPVHELKIDRCLVAPMLTDTADRLIVGSVIRLGHHLGLTLVAEGVEDDETLAALTELGCDVAQGYVLSRPLPVAAFDTWRVERSDAAGTGAP